MEFVTKWFMSQFLMPGQKPEIWLLAAIVAAFVATFVFHSNKNSPKVPPELSDPIPYIYNTFQFLFRNERFTNRALDALEKSNVVKFHLGPKQVYLLAGPQNLQVLFSSPELSYEEIFVTQAFPKFWRFNKEEVKLFAEDKSGAGRIPLPGTETTPPEQRYWAARHRVHYDFVGRPFQFRPLVQAFRDSFMKEIDVKFPVGQSVTVSVRSLCRDEVASCFVSTLFGPHILALNPNFIECFWEFDEVFFNLILGVPRWMYRRPFDTYERHLSMIDRYLGHALENFEWDGLDSSAFWEPLFGGRICRELVRWLMDAGFRREALVGALGSLVFAQTSNSIPTATWMLMELFKDPTLFQKVKEEVETARVDNDSQHLDIDKLVALPLLQSIFIETLRLRMSLNIIRTLKTGMVIDGYKIPEGAYLQAPTMAAHYDEKVWGRPGHPAAEFWAERHVRYVEGASGKEGRKRVLDVAGRPSSFFPFGGGTPICPGRHFAKAEIFMMVGIIVDRFDVQFVKWTKLDGSSSDRAAWNDARYSAAGASPPDRDMVARLKRRW